MKYQPQKFLVSTAVKEMVHISEAQRKAPPGYGWAYYAEDLIKNRLGYKGQLWSHPDLSIVDTVDRLGAPMAASPNRTAQKASRPRRGTNESSRTSSAVGHSAHGRRQRTSVAARSSKCPKGHYWSFKEKKCVRSKF